MNGWSWPERQNKEGGSSKEPRSELESGVGLDLTSVHRPIPGVFQGSAPRSTSPARIEAAWNFHFFLFGDLDDLLGFAGKYSSISRTSHGRDLNGARVHCHKTPKTRLSKHLQVFIGWPEPEPSR